MVAGVPNSRYGNEGELFTSALKARYTERALRGNLFTFFLGATTTGVAAGNISGAAAAASTQFALWNPAGSGKTLALLQMWISPISGTPPAGCLFHNVATAPSIAGTSPTNANPGSSVAPVARGQASAAGAALTGGGILTAVRPTSLYFSNTAFANAGGGIGLEDIGGSLIITPGFMWVPCWSAAGTTLLNGYGVLFEEIPQ